jgi:hypothetical protein
MKIIWNVAASNSHLKILDFLLLIWNDQIATDFNNLILKAEKQLMQFPFSGAIYLRSICKILLHKNASFYYEYDENTQTHYHFTIY